MLFHHSVPFPGSFLPLTFERSVSFPLLCRTFVSPLAARFSPNGSFFPPSFPRAFLFSDRPFLAVLAGAELSNDVRRYAIRRFFFKFFRLFPALVILGSSRFSAADLPSAFPLADAG